MDIMLSIEYFNPYLTLEWLPIWHPPTPFPLYLIQGILRYIEQFIIINFKIDIRLYTGTDLTQKGADWTPSQ